MIIETTGNRFYLVTETGNPDLAHVWYGAEVKFVKGAWHYKKGAKIELVRKAGSRAVGEGITLKQQNAA